MTESTEELPLEREAWRCGHCGAIRVQADEPWAIPGPENRLSWCATREGGHDWQPVRVRVLDAPSIS